MNQVKDFFEKRHWLSIVVFACFALGFGLAVGFTLGKMLNPASPQKGFQAVSSEDNRRIRPSISYSASLKKARQAVVNVFSEKTVKRAIPLDVFFYDLFGEERENYYAPVQRRQRSLGSGVVISADGFILTNSHVISGAEKIFVAFTDGKEIEAKLIGQDNKTDLALLKVERNNVPYLAFGDSDQLEVGDVVLAIGNPFGIGQTVTMGIVSAKGRENLGILDYEDFIQTDAAINPGNSGGALIDGNGHLVGINTALFSRSGGYQGIGFSVPSNLARKIAEELKQNGKIKRSYLGVSVVNLQEVNNPLTMYLRENGYTGALVIRVEANGPADKAGIKTGTLISKINGAPVQSAESLFKLVSQSPPDKTLEVEAQLIDLQTGKVSKDTYFVRPRFE